MNNIGTWSYIELQLLNQYFRQVNVIMVVKTLTINGHSIYFKKYQVKKTSVKCTFKALYRHKILIIISI